MMLAVFGGWGFSAGGGSVFWRAAAAAADSAGANFGGFGCVGLGGWSSEAVDALIVQRR